MGISPLELQGGIARTQDFSMIRQNEDQKAVLDQGHFQQQLDKQLNEKTHQVNQQANADYLNKKFDAKDKGSNSYHGDGGKKKKESDEGKNKNGNVFAKSPHGFDVRI